MNYRSDLTINCAVRRVLVRHWIDLGRISIRTVSGVIHLSGTLIKLPKVNPPLVPRRVTELMDEIRAITGVRRLQTDFANWYDAGTGWLPIAEKLLNPLLKRQATTSQSVAIDLSEAEAELDRQEQEKLKQEQPG